MCKIPKNHRLPKLLKYEHIVKRIGEPVIFYILRLLSSRRFDRNNLTYTRNEPLRLRSGFFMHCAWPHVGPVQSHARLCCTRPDPDTVWIHGY